MREISRRAALRAMAGAAGVGAVACTTRGGGRTAPSLPPLPAKAGELAIATWPLYIDVDPATKQRPTVDEFTKTTGIKVRYDEVIGDAEAFIEEVRPALAAGTPPEWDIAVLPNWLVGRLARDGSLQPLHHDALPAFAASAGPLFKNPSYDPANRYSAAWQGGITGIAYNPRQTLREITSFADLFDPAFAGRVGLLSDMLDTMTLAMLSLGIEVERATVADARRARDLLREHRSAVKGFFGEDHATALAKGDLALTMAWSGDIFDAQTTNPDLQFVVPKEGGIIWSDDMVILRGAAHPTDAHAWINHVYNPVFAGRIAASVHYVSPVPLARQVMLADAERLKDPAEKADAERAANSSLLFPTADTTDRLHRYPVLSDGEHRAWSELFAEVSSG